MAGQSRGEGTRRAQGSAGGEETERALAQGDVRARCDGVADGGALVRTPEATTSTGEGLQVWAEQGSRARGRTYGGASEEYARLPVTELGQKFNKFVEDKAASVLPDQHYETKHSTKELSQASTMSCLLSSVDSAESHDQKSVFESHTSGSLVASAEALPLKQVITQCSFAVDVVDLSCLSKDIPQIVDSDESVNGSNPCSPGDLSPNKAPYLGISNVVHDLNSTRHLEPSNRSTRLPNFICDQLQRKAIPFGPRFQADIPEWDDTAGTSVLTGAYNSDPNNLKWLGSLVWPIKIGNKKSMSRRIGEGRPRSCSCISPGTADCIKRHILEERLLLQHELGPTFSSWKFDEMGEQVAESWSLREQHAFALLMKKRPSSDEKCFWNRALKCFPRKSKKDIINYYFNVYITRRMSLQRRLPSAKQVDTDDEEEECLAESFDCTLLQKRVRRGNLIIPTKKAKYLRSS